MLRPLYQLPIITGVLLLPGCTNGGLSLKASECPAGQVRKGGTLCVPDQASGSPLGAVACEDPDLAALKAGTRVMLCDGTLGVGTMVVDVVDELPVCSADGEQDCWVKGDFKAAKVGDLSASDIRLGKTILGITGTKREMKQCRNAARLTLWDASSLANAQTATSSPDGIADPWDTIDDSGNWVGSPVIEGPWGDSYVCNTTNFTDVSAAGLAGLTPTGTSPSGANQTFSTIWRDDLTRLYFTNILKNNSAGSNWLGVMNMCANLDSGDGAGKWRLPTQKELLQLYVNGIAKLAIGGGSLNNYFWSSTDVSTGGNAWGVTFSRGSSGTGIGRASTTGSAICVR